HGWVGWLVSFASVVGVLTSLMLHPGRFKPESRWVATTDRVFYAAILPLVGLLFVGLGRRFGDYGLTERRYFLAVLGVWLAAIAVTRLVARKPNIRLIPVSLCLVALVTAVGPWGAYQASRASQGRRLQALLVQHGLYADGRPRRAPSSSSVSLKD